MFRLFDPYAMAMCFLVGGVGFGITYYINTAVTEWGAEEIVYPMMAMVRPDTGCPSGQKNSKRILGGGHAALLWKEALSAILSRPAPKVMEKRERALRCRRL